MKIQKDDHNLVITDEKLSCKFDNTNGKLVSMKQGDKDFKFSGVTVDVGCQGDYLLKTLEFHSMLDAHTWDLPGIRPRKDYNEPKFIGFEEGSDFVTAVYDVAPLEIRLVYSFAVGTLKVTAEVINKESQELWLNGLAFISTVDEDIMFDFPSNIPCFDDMKTSELKDREAVTTGLINCNTHTKIGGKDFNFNFLDPIEKWGCGVWKDGNSSKIAYVPNLEVMIKPNEKIVCGDLYLQIPENNPFTAIRDLFAGLGYKPSEDGIKHGVMYSGHPSGTLDKNFPLKLTMREYAENLDELKEIGIDHVWLLPLFDHGEENVYHSTDQAIIDARYGSDEDVKYYCDKAHDLGMTVLFDYVPHGPSPEFPLAKNNPDWCSKRQDGSLHDEWNCVSFDYNHPGYLKYTEDLVYDHVKRFGVDGARIDCAMGGLSNWRPYGDNRPSANSVQSGVNISKATRDGFIKGGKIPFNMPENFNPVPTYFPETEVFYGMNLYRVFCDIDSIIHSDPAKYTKVLTSWLEREYLTTPENYVKMRFLGNHDTVAWVWQSARAVDYYGVDAAKALWSAMSFIDGMVMIYQGDEDPKWYLVDDSPVLKDFFKEIFSARKTHLEDDMKTKHLYTDSSVMAFIRYKDNKKRLVLVNIGKDATTVSYDKLDTKVKKLLAGNANSDDSGITLDGYQYAIYEI